MRVTIGGVRGSFPVARRDTVRYGGETTSVLVEGADGSRVLLDLGSGVGRLAKRLVAADRRRLTVLLTHYHLDHLIGLPALPLLYCENGRIEFIAPRMGACDVEPALRRFLSPPFWPLGFEGLPARVRFTALAEGSEARPLQRGGLRIRWCALHHPTGCAAYRVDEPATGAVLVFATDVEWGLSSAAERSAFIALASGPRPPDLLLFDAHVPPASRRKYRRWGHSTWQEAGEVGRAVGARAILGIHHAPEHGDKMLDRMAAKFRAAFPEGRFARAGQSFTIGS